MVNIIKSKGLEEKTFSDILKNGEINPKEHSLIFSNIQNKRELNSYLRKFDLLANKALDYNKDNLNSDYQITKSIFDYLNSQKLDRFVGYQPVLTKAIDSQLIDYSGERVGDCRTLTALDTILANELGVNNIGILENGDHIKSYVMDNSKKVLIEHTSSNGFGLEDSTKYREKSLDFLVPCLIEAKSGNILNNSGNPKEAIKYSNWAIALDADFPEAYINRAIARFQLDIPSQNKKAVRDLEEARDRGIDNFTLYKYLGMVSSRLGNNEEAVEHFNSALDFSPGFFVKTEGVFSERGRAFYQLNKFDEAISDFNFELQNGSSNNELYYMLGLSYLKNKNFDNAIKNFESFIELEDRKAAHYFLARAKAKKDGFNSSWDEYKKFANLNHPNIKRILNKKKIGVKTTNKDLEEVFDEDDVSNYCNFNY